MRWAKRAMAVSQRFNREHPASQEALESLLADEKAPVERVRTMLCLAETMFETGLDRREDARSIVEQAIGQAEVCDAVYSVARGCSILAAWDPERRDALLRKAVTAGITRYGYQDRAYEALAGPSGRLTIWLGTRPRIAIDGNPVRASVAATNLLVALASNSAGLEPEVLAEMLWGR